MLWCDNVAALARYILLLHDLRQGDQALNKDMQDVAPGENGATGTTQGDNDGMVDFLRRLSEGKETVQSLVTGQAEGCRPRAPALGGVASQSAVALILESFCRFFA